MNGEKLKSSLKDLQAPGIKHLGWADIYNNLCIGEICSHLPSLSSLEYHIGRLVTETNTKQIADMIPKNLVTCFSFLKLTQYKERLILEYNNQAGHPIFLKLPHLKQLILTPLKLSTSLLNASTVGCPNLQDLKLSADYSGMDQTDLLEFFKKAKVVGS